ncbi:hypothetical protein [Promicromonospora sp. NPDC023805]|uniref:hypothetical protein n=1 Tax=Promicromonospora sp. NPDC023805 TaxID=3154696 RepID=UPI0033DF1519
MSIIRNGLTRKALAGTTLAALLLVGGAVAVPTTATAAPVVVSDEVNGTVFRAKLEAKGDVLMGHTTKPRQIDPFDVQWAVALGTEGGIVTDVDDAYLTLQRVGSDSTRRYTLSFDEDLRIGGTVELPPTVIPGAYDVGLEVTAKVKRGGQVTTHSVDVRSIKQVQLRRETILSDYAISNSQDTHGEPGTLTGQVKRLRVQYPTGIGSYNMAGGVTVRIYHHASPYTEDATYITSVKTNGAGRFTVPIRAKQGYWNFVVVGNAQYTWTKDAIAQGVTCGC